MIESTIPIIKHIPRFLDYCRREKGLSNHTQESYNRYLKRFISWLKDTKKESVLPYQLTIDDVSDYKLYLSSKYKYKGKFLEKITQNYYLIALRALLGYFLAKDIVSLPADKIKLPRGFQQEKSEKILELEQINRLLDSPDLKKETGLRDRVLLETIIHCGLKVSQLEALNRNIKNDFPEEASVWIRNYLEIRKDNKKPLFINYRGRNPQSRLTRRSIERIVQKYGRKISLPFFITPEILRWAYARALLEQQNSPQKIKKLQTHQTSVIRAYESNIREELLDKKISEKTLYEWHVIESVINKEMAWLKNNIPVMPEKYKQNPLSCSDNEMLRKIAILIISGKIKATEFKAKSNKDLWDNFTKKINRKKISHHGEEWHSKMMSIMNEYFKLKNYNVTVEPVLHYGRADLGVRLNSRKTLYIEVGTVSLYKIWHNLSSMKNATLLIIPSEDRAIEFNT